MNVKKLFAALLAASLIVASTAGCAAGGTSSSAAAPAAAPAATEAAPTEAPAPTEAETEAAAPASAWTPPNNMTYVASAGVGGGIDTFTRTLAQALNTSGVVAETITCDNMTGGGGLVAIQTFTDVYTGRDDLLLSGSGGLVSLEVANNTTLRQSDLVPIARMAVETMTMVVSADNTELDTVDKVIERLKSDPGSITFGGDMPPAQDYLSMVTLCSLLGVDYNLTNYVYQDGTVLPALMGGHIDIAFSGAAEWSAAIEAGQVKAIAVAAEERLSGMFAEVPTFKESGVEFLWQNWRGMLGPRDMPEEAIAYWRDAMQKVYESPEWKDAEAKLMYEPGFMIDGFGEFMADYEAMCENALKIAGVIE